MSKIKTVATCTIPLLMLFTVYYIYRGMEWQLNMAFLDPDRWLASRFVDPDAVIAKSTRILYFAMWQIPLYAGTIALGTALRILLLLRRGILFDLKISRAISWLGLMTALSAATELIAAALSPKVLSLHNADGPAPLRFWYSSTSFSLLFYGIAFVMMGWVLSEAIKIDRENKEFV